MDKNNTIVRGLKWKLLERFSVSGIQFILQLILARILDPYHYGILALMNIFLGISNIFVQTGFSAALIQRKDVEEEDYSSVFWVSLGISFVMYLIIFFFAPSISRYYEMPEMLIPLRVLAFLVIPGALNSIQLAKVSREMNFKNVFISNIAGIIVSGIVGIVLAYMGAGLWSLVVQSILGSIITTVIMWYTVSWHPKLVFNIKRVKMYFGFGWKLLISGLLDTVYQNLSSLIIGKKYDSNTLGYYNRGMQFPQFIINGINGAVMSVLLPAMSSEQDNRGRLKSIMRNSISLSAYIVFPMMAGLAGIATALISLLLTDKWLHSVPYLQIYCFTLALYPVHSANLQAINAVGRSDVFLKLEIIKKLLGMITLITAVVLFDSPIAIAMAGAVTTFISFFINAYPNKKLIDYSYFEQIRDILPSLLSSLAMFFVVLVLGTLNLSPILILAVQIAGGVIIYISISYIFKFRELSIIKNLLVNMLRGGAGNMSS